jgi:hypothetical protein
MSPARVDPGWLALRADTDRAARRSADPLAAKLARHLVTRLADRRPARLVDVGAGTGAGAAWLRPRLPIAQQWRLVDRDGDLLRGAPPIRDGWARPVPADVADLPALLGDEPADAVTCQALLDLLTEDQLRDMVEPAARAGSAVFFGLSVTGRVTLTPPHPEDAAVGEAFNAHQRRGGRLGPDAGTHAHQMLRSHRYHVTEVDTAWLLDASRIELTVAWLHGRAAAAAEQAPNLTERVVQWLDDRVAAARRGELTAIVQHVDVLGIPAAR